MVFSNRKPHLGQLTFVLFTMETMQIFAICHVIHMFTVGMLSVLIKVLGTYLLLIIVAHICYLNRASALLSTLKTRLPLLF